MKKNKILFLVVIVLIVVSLAVSCYQPEKADTNENGRYSIIVHGSNIILLDTKTGTFWRKFLLDNQAPTDWKKEVLPE